MTRAAIRGRVHKYGAVRTEIDGHTFASKAEARRYGELKLLEKAGEIRNLRLQPRFALMAAVVEGGRENINEGRVVGMRIVGEYRADFDYERRVDHWPSDREGVYRAINREGVYCATPGPRPFSSAATTPGMNVTWEFIVEDVKGMITDLYSWKRRHMAAQYGIEIQEIGRKR